MKRARPKTPTQQKFVFGTMKDLLGPQDREALFDAIERPLSDDALAAFDMSELEAPDK